MAVTEGPWLIGLPGGPSGPFYSFYSLVNPQGWVVAMQIPNRDDAEFIVRLEENQEAAKLREETLRRMLQEKSDEYLQIERIAMALVEDVDAFARVFGFVVPANASKLKAILAGKSPRDWQDFRDPNKSTEVY